MAVSPGLGGSVSSLEGLLVNDGGFCEFPLGLLPVFLGLEAESLFMFLEASSGLTVGEGI